MLSICLRRLRVGTKMLRVPVAPEEIDAPPSECKMTPGDTPAEALVTSHRIAVGWK